jgi:hypothetical protein
VKGLTMSRAAAILWLSRRDRTVVAGALAGIVVLAWTYILLGAGVDTAMNMAANQTLGGRVGGPLQQTPAELDLSVVDPSKAGAYPIVTFSWLLLYRQYADPGKGAAVRDFVAWGLSSGQAFGREFGYIPMPDEVAASGRRALGGVGY